MEIIELPFYKGTMEEWKTALLADKTIMLDLSKEDEEHLNDSGIILISKIKVVNEPLYVLDDDYEDVIDPNGKLINEEILNFEFKDLKEFSLSFDFWSFIDELTTELNINYVKGTTDANVILES